MQRTLEIHAKDAYEKGGSYIRPIVLFQAQPKSTENATTFEKLRQRLIAANIPAEQIAIKTAEINELKNVDLLSEKCSIRFIITVNALKEGWDCPFAYILASLANRTSQVDVEQIAYSAPALYPETFFSDPEYFVCSDLVCGLQAYAGRHRQGLE